MVYCARMMETASLRTLSPKMIAFKLTFTFWSLNMASTVTGSVAEMIAPKNRQSVNEK